MVLRPASLTLVKYAVDMASLAQYRIQVQDLCDWFRNSFLELNVAKTEKLVVFKKKGTEMPVSLFICSESVEIVSSFRYLGIIIDESMTFAEHTDKVYKKISTEIVYFKETAEL